MSTLKNFLILLERVGYPSPRTSSVADQVGYNLDNFLSDLENELGDKGVVDFCDKAIHKLTGEQGLRIDLGGPNGDEFVYIHIYPVFFDEDESENDIISNHSWGDSHLLGTNENGEETYMTIQEIIDNTGMGEWGELDELIDHIKSKAYNKVFYNCGFGVWWQ